MPDSYAELRAALAKPVRAADAISPNDVRALLADLDKTREALWRAQDHLSQEIAHSDFLRSKLDADQEHERSE